MRTKIEAVLTPIWLLALSILVTIYLAWGFYYFDIDWMHLLDYVILGKTELWHNFNVLMQYLTFPWVGHLAMPDFPSSESGLKHFHDVKWQSLLGLWEFFSDLMSFLRSFMKPSFLEIAVGSLIQSWIRLSMFYQKSISFNVL